MTLNQDPLSIVAVNVKTGFKQKSVVLASNARTFSSGGQLQDTPWEEGDAPGEGPDGIDERLKQVYEANSPLFLQPSPLDPISLLLIFPPRMP